MKSRAIVIVVIALLLANLLVQAPLWANRGTVFEQLNLLVDLRHEIVQQYVEAPDQDKLVKAAVAGMIESLEDPYTTYLSPEDLKQFDKRIRGSFSGIGAEVRVHDQGVEIVTPLEDSPAWRAGISAGDIIVEIEGTSTKGMDINQAVELLTGPRGTPVKVKVRHTNGKEELIEIIRAQINVTSIKGISRKDGHWNYMLDPANKVGYIRITQFTSTTADDLRQAIDQLNNQGMRGLIIDLRFDPGGLLDAAVDVADMFLEAGKTIVSVKGRVVPEQVHKATSEGMLTDVPMVVLANEASASASEILTGALADHQRAKFVGTRTFGKGSVQQIRMLESGLGAIKITNAYYYLPSGRNIHRRPDSKVWGVDPEDGFYVPMTIEQIEKMNKLRRENDILQREVDPAAAQVKMTPEWIEAELADLQLAAGLRALTGFIKTNQWPIVGQTDVAGAMERVFEADALRRELDLHQTRITEIEEKLRKLAAGEPIEPEQDDPLVQKDAAEQQTPEAAPEEPEPALQP